MNRTLAALPPLLLAATAGAQSPPAIYRNLTVDISVRETPTAVPLTDGKYHVAYFMLVTNWTDRDLSVRSIEIGAPGGEPLARFDSLSLSNQFRFRSTYGISGQPGSASTHVLQTGRTAMVSVEFTLPSSALPPQLTHTLRFAPDSGLLMRNDDGTTSSDLVARSAPITTGKRTLLVIGAPLRGGPWLCGNGLAFNNSHATAYPFRTAQLRVPQRFGCDWLKSDSAGSILPNPFPDTISNKMFYGYGAEVLAVADGVVEYVKDGIPENVPRADGRVVMAVPLTNETVSGNWVSLRIADSVYAFYAHLQPGSIRVRVGQRVRRGEVLGLVGNTGNAVNPHLHFHIGNANSLNGSDAVPHVYQAFTWLGDGALDAVPEARANQLPGPGAIVRFP